MDWGEDRGSHMSPAVDQFLTDWNVILTSLSFALEPRETKSGPFYDILDFLDRSPGMNKEHIIMSMYFFFAHNEMSSSACAQIGGHCTLTHTLSLYYNIL